MLKRPWSRKLPAVLSALLLLSLHASLVRAQPAAGPAWGTLSVPGGTAAFRCAAQLPPDLPRAELLIALSRQVALNTLDETTWKRLRAYADWLDGIQDRSTDARGTRKREGGSVGFLRDCPGLDVDRVAAQVSAGDSVALLPASDDLPSPIAAEEWMVVLEHIVPARVFTSLIRDPVALRLYQALTAVEPETVRYLVAHPSLARELVADDRRMFATFAPSLMIRAGVVVVPGGGVCARAWSRIVGNMPHETEAFVRRVFTGDDGRLAYFYAAIDALPPGRVPFAFADATGKLSEEAAGQLYETFRTALPAWKITDRPIPLWLDPASALMEFEWNADGQLKGPAWQRLWDEAFGLDRVPPHQDRLARGVENGGRLSAASVMRRVFAHPELARSRFEMFRFAQRVYGESSEQMPADVLAGVVAFRRYPALMLGLERMGIHDPAALATIARAADRLGEGKSEESIVLISQWQSAVALIEALRRTGAIDPGTALTWLKSAAAIQPTGDGWFDGGLARWLQATVLPGLALDASSHANVEQGLLALISAPVNAHPQAVEWDGLTYNVDIVGAQTRRARRIADVQMRPRLDDVLSLESAAQALRGATTATDVRAVSAVLHSRLAAFKMPLSSTAVFTDTKPPSGADYVAIALRDLDRIKRDHDVPQAERVAAGLRRLCDRSLGQVLTALLYAGRLGAGTGTPEQYGDLWRRHDLGFRIKSKTFPAQWRPASTDALDSRGGFLTGSLIGFDLALGKVLLRSVPGGPGGKPAAVPDPYVVPLLQMVPLAASCPGGGDAIQLGAVVEALERGRSRWTEMRRTRPIEASSFVGARRANLASWLDAHDASAAQHDITLSELVQLGRDDRIKETTLAAVGVPALGKDGCWCARFAASRVFRSSAADRTLANVASDMYVTLAELLVRTRMPPSVLPSLIAAATSDLLSRMAPTAPDDWPALERAISAIDTDRQEQLLFALVSMKELEATGGTGGW
jgi:hypothetical protein